MRQADTRTEYVATRRYIDTGVSVPYFQNSEDKRVAGEVLADMCRQHRQMKQGYSSDVFCSWCSLLRMLSLVSEPLSALALFGTCLLLEAPLRVFLATSKCQASAADTGISPNTSLFSGYDGFKRVLSFIHSTERHRILCTNKQATYVAMSLALPSNLLRPHSFLPLRWSAHSMQALLAQRVVGYPISGGASRCKLSFPHNDFRFTPPRNRPPPFGESLARRGVVDHVRAHPAPTPS